jgi:hypothetical protein
MRKTTDKKPSPLSGLPPTPPTSNQSSPKQQKLQTPPKPTKLEPAAAKPFPPAGRGKVPYTSPPGRRRSEDNILFAKKQPMPIPVPTGRPLKPFSRNQHSTSPEESDSDPEENYTNCAVIETVKRYGQRTYSTCSTMMSEESGPKRPVATPRKSKSVSMRVSQSPQVPPKPNLPPRPTNVPKFSAQFSLPVGDEPSRPLRPRPSEIKRAKDRARAANPRNKSPMLMVVDEHGLETMSTVSAKSAKSNASSKSNISSKSAPLSGNAKVATRRSSEVTNFLIPESAHNRQRRRSANDEPYPQAPREVASSAPGGLGGDLMAAGGVNKQVADTLLKYIMSSDDPNLKAALRDLVQDSGSAQGKQ